MSRSPAQSVVVRPVTRQEAVEYFRLMPYANGLPHWEPYPAAWHGGEGPLPPRSAPRTYDSLVAESGDVDEPWFRPFAAFVDGRPVGGSAMLSLEATVPGAGPVPMGSVTSTAVAATHRRRGLLRRLMTAMLFDACDRGEPLAGLSASEGSIYGRYGFSPATFHVRWEVERHQADFVTDPDDESMDRLALVGADEAKAAWPGLHERIRSERVGEVSAHPGKWASLSDEVSGTDGATYYVLHRDAGGVVDGIAHYRIPWSPHADTAGTAVVDACEALTPQAYDALWRMLLDLDLTKRISASHRPVDEPLRWMLANPRALRTTRSADNLWLRILDVRTALQLRNYGADARLVLEIGDPILEHNHGRWELDATTDGASVSATSASPDLTMDIGVVGSLYLGGVAPAALAAAGRIREHTDGAVRRLDGLFRQDPAPFNYAGF